MIMILFANLLSFSFITICVHSKDQIQHRRSISDLWNHDLFFCALSNSFQFFGAFITYFMPKSLCLASALQLFIISFKDQIDIYYTAHSYII